MSATAGSRGKGFEFLGYRFEAGQRQVRKKSLNKFKDSIREKTRRTRGDSLACVVADLNPTVARLVRLLQTRPSHHLRQARRVCQATAARHPAQAGEAAVGHGRLPRRPSTLAKCLLRGSRAVRTSHGLAIGETVSMKKPSTGEPYAGEPPVRFGGRGRRKPIPTPISRSLTFPAVRAPQVAGRRGNALRGRASGGRAGFSRWRSAFGIEIGSLEVSVFPLINRDVRRQAPLRGPIPKAPGFAGGYLLTIRLGFTGAFS